MELILKHQIDYRQVIENCKENLICDNCCLFCNNCGDYMRTCLISHTSAIYCHCRDDIDMCMENAFHWHRLAMEEVLYEIEKYGEEDDDEEVIERQNVFEYLMREEEMHMRKPSKYICDIIINDFISKEKNCPITMDVLTYEEAGLTSCFHVFNKNMVLNWVMEHKTCPSCRKECVVWGATHMI